MTGVLGASPQSPSADGDPSEWVSRLPLDKSHRQERLLAKGLRARVETGTQGLVGGVEDLHQDVSKTGRVQTRPGDLARPYHRFPMDVGLVCFT